MWLPQNFINYDTTSKHKEADRAWRVDAYVQVGVVAFLVRRPRFAFAATEVKAAATAAAQVAASDDATEDEEALEHTEEDG